MVAHGLCSPGLFALANYVYVLFSSRSLFVCSGVLGLVPALSLCWFLISSANIAFPPSLRLLSELLLIMSIVSVSLWLMVPIGLIVFVTGAYSLILYSCVQHGSGSRLRGVGGILGIDHLLIRCLL